MDPTTDPTPTPAPEPTPQPTPPAEPQPDSTPTPAAPDDDQKLARLERERDSWKQQVADMQAQIAAAAKADDKDAELARIKTEAETAQANLTKQLESERKAARIDVLLAAKGCKDIQMAHSAIDMDAVTVADDGALSGFDVDSFATSKAFLFEPVVTVSTGGQQGGAATGGGMATSIHAGVAATRKKG